MPLLDGETYSQYKKELLKEYRLLLRTLGKEHRGQKLAVVRDAFDLAAKAHEGTLRKSGEPYIFHPLAVAQIAVGELGLGATSAACALMHDVVEDTEYTVEDIEQKFGTKIASIIDGLTKISTVFDTVEKDSSIQAENFKKMLLTLGEDLRVILIKLCDRLHNMRTLGTVSEKTRLKIASETLYIYAPLAHRLGLYAVKTEMEDLALKYTEPELYKEISGKIAESKNSRQKYIKEFIEPINIELQKSGLEITEIQGRPKSIYSIAQKMKKQNIPFEEVFDIFAVRIVVNSPYFLEKADCWKVYSIISDKYRSHTNRLRDWLSHPKSNGYEALHTTVLGPMGRWVEVQIRSKRMNDIAERGLAAHWKYKQGNEVSTPQDAAFENWLNLVKETLENKDLSALDLVSEFKFSVLGEEIYIFTPKGDVKNLPIGSTALDFAFAIHSEVGKSTIGAKVNNKLVPINHVVKNGDIVEIITTQKPRVNPDWLHIVITGRAKSKIREHLKAEKSKQSSLGKEIIERKLKNQDQVFNEKNIAILTKYFNMGSAAEFYHAVAMGDIKSEKLRFAEILSNKGVKSEISETKQPENKKKKPVTERKKPATGMIVIGDDFEMDYSLAKCCNPLPGDSIFGFITVGEGVKVHRVNCPNATRLMSQYGYRIIPTLWRTDGYNKPFEAKLSVSGIDDVGIVSRITDIISKDMEVNMKSINIRGKDDGTFEGQLEVFLLNVEHLEQLMEKIKGTHQYIEVKRLDD
ncbi:MAG: bifunctional (p)ppGpp synthetase/guanosine-3',5'-bis(diphosphate) 3'-pyrophosphohydrolase [Bacteroidia bacterium]|nr:bifunctional (p)ppGpp synthetase/guanosine-3',5'-bis(diphosphate) 3'-pyrophosphohydrolase [Bacteroidia bacterium]